MTRKLAALVLGSLIVGAIAVTSASAATDANAASFVSKANAERTSRGLPALRVATDLTAIAKHHSEDMAAKQTLYHNPNLATEVSNWQVVGENVGDGGTVQSIHDAFMNSPEHRANILATDYTEIGIGTVTDANGVIWVTQVFRLPYKATVTHTAPAKPHVVTQRRTVTKPRVVAKPAVKAEHTVAVPERADAASFVGALAGAADPFGQAVVFTETVGALA